MSSRYGKNLIFLISQPRAGSTLLQLILAGHPEVHTTSEPWIMLHPLYALKCKGYTAEYETKLAKNALTDFCQTLPEGEETYINAIRKMTLSLYKSSMAGSRKSLFLDKTPRYYYIIPELYHVFPEAKYIFLLRNPLAVLSSIMETWIQNKWDKFSHLKNDLLLAPQLLIDGIEHLKEKAVVLHYEKLVKAPVETLTFLCNKLQINFHEPMIDYSRLPKLQGRMGDPVGIHKHTCPFPGYIDKWQKNLALTPKNQVASAYLSFLGPNLFSRLGYSFKEQQNNLLTVRNPKEQIDEQLINDILSHLGLNHIKYNENKKFKKNTVAAKRFKIDTSSDNSHSSIKVSAIISTYNSENFIRGCLQDLVDQTLFQNGALEIIVVNSGSEQYEEAIAKDFQLKYTNIKYIKTAERETIYQAWNRGIEEASGTYITNANTDDRHRKDALTVMASALDANPSISLVYADAAVTEKENEPFGTEQIMGHFRWPEFDPRLLFQVCYIGPQPMWRRTLHERYGYFDTEFLSAGDYEFWLRIATHENFLHIPEVLGLYLQSPGSIEHQNRQRTHDESEKARKRYWQSSLGQRPKPGGNFFKPATNSIVPKDETVPGNNPKVSVILPTYNRPEMLRNALQSILNQTYQDFEVIVINDGGHDVTHIIEPLNSSNNIHYIGLERNSERSYARNIGIKAARGTYIAYLDDDDEYYPEHLETLTRFLENSIYKIAYTDAHRVHKHKENGIDVVTKKDLQYSIDFDPDLILVKNLTPTLCIMHERLCLEHVGLFDESLTTHEDWDLWIRISRKFPFAHIKKVTCAFSWRDDGATTTSSMQEDFLRTRKTIYERYREYTHHKPLVKEKQEELLQKIAGRLNRVNQTNEKAKQVSIILPVYNNARLTGDCLKALVQNTQYPNYEVIIIDNNSTDNTGALLKTLVGDVTVITNQDNLGFAKACNQGAKAAAGDCLVFLNNDTIPQKGWLTALVHCIQQHPDAGIVGSKLLYPDGTIQHCGAAMRYDGRFFRHPYKFLDANHPLVNNVREWDAVTAACCITPKELFFKMGLFNETYLNGCEDMDYCTAVRAAGYKIYYTPHAVLYHLESQTPRTTDTDKTNFTHYVSKWGRFRIKNEIEMYADDDFWVQENGFFKHNYSDAALKLFRQIQQAQKTENFETLNRYNKVLGRIYPVERWDKKQLY